MKVLFCLISFFMIVNCSSNKSVYWCGDHPCINKKEKEAYFQKTMIVEVKKIKNKKDKKNSAIEKIIQQAQVEEKKRIKKAKDLTKQAKLDEKRQIKEEKALAKQAKLDEKRQIKEEKALAKKVGKDEKKIQKNKKLTAKKSVEINSDIEIITNKTFIFKRLVEKITKRNSLRPYPDINDIPN